MTRWPAMRTNLLIAAVAAALGAASPARAILITFDGPGYSAGGTTTTTLGVNGSPIHGQGSPTTWTDSAANPNFAVVGTAGNGGNGLVSATSQVQFTNAIFTPSLSDLGVAAFDLNTRQDFSLDARLLDNANLSASSELYRLGIGATSGSVFPLELRIRANGNVQAYMNNALQFTMTGALTEGGAYRTFSGSIDYVAHQVTVFLDGSATPAGSFTFTGNDTGYGRFSINVRQTSSTVGIALDNLGFAVSPVPEPATLTLAALGAGIVFARRTQGV